ncbi:MAG: carboxypeptidase-like regulatory domain-containing protein, partial [Candidatus Sericytochromatia bacterium]|nr:carboxypeptidase-like regulatory domain-containing protein [Candidatus Sericytochromatia bacterium]
ASPTPGPTGSPSPSAARTLTGEVRDLADAPLAGVTVTARSLEAATAFEGETRTGPEGRWSLAGLPPAGTMLEVWARGAGLTPRRRVVTVGEGATTLMFGGAGAGAAFFLSDRPEVTAVEPLPDGELGAAAVRLRLALSRPLAPESRARFAAALRLLPANDTAGRGSTDLSRRPRSHPAALRPEAAAPWALQVDSRLSRRSPVRARVSWEAEGQTALLTFGGALPTGGSRGRYQLLLVSDGRPLVDEAGQALGTGPSGEARGVWEPGQVVLGAFLAPDPDLGAVSGLPAASADARWAGTHDAALGFWTPRDDDAPTLVAVDHEEAGSDTRLRLTFDEPLVAFDGSDEGRRGAGTGLVAADLGGLGFLVAERGKLRLDALRDGRTDEAVVLDPRVTTRFGVSAERNTAFVFAPAAFVPVGDPAPPGSVQLAPDPADPTTLVLTLVGRSGFFDPALEGLAVRVEGVGDPAGNRRRRTLADANVVAGTL